MTKAFRTISDVLRSPLASIAKGCKAQTTDRVLRSTKLEDGIYADLRAGDDAMDELETAAGQKLRTFPALSRDVYQSFYSLMPKRNEESELSVMAQKFNRHILDHVMQSEDYATIKNVCEGRDLPAYIAETDEYESIAITFDENGTGRLEYWDGDYDFKWSVMSDGTLTIETDDFYFYGSYYVDDTSYETYDVQWLQIQLFNDVIWMY